MMPQDSGPIGRYSLSIALKDHIFEEVPTIVTTWRSIWIYTILEKKFTTVRWARDKNNWPLTCMGSSPPQYDASTASSQLSNPPPVLSLCVKVYKGNNEIKAKLTFDQVSHLQKCHWLRICQGHSIFKVK